MRSSTLWLRRIPQRLEEFNDDQLLLAIEAHRYERKRLQAKKEELVSTTTTTEVLPENATQEPHIEELIPEKVKAKIRTKIKSQNRRQGRNKIKRRRRKR